MSTAIINTEESLVKEYNKLHSETIRLGNYIDAATREALSALKKNDYGTTEVALLTKLSFQKQLNTKLDEMLSILKKLKEIKPSSNLNS